MNRYFHILIVSGLILVMLASGCTEGGGTFSIFGLELGPGEPVYTQYENLLVETEAVPSEVFEGKTTNLFFDFYNKGNTTLRDIKIRITDLAGFTASETSKSIGELEEGEMLNWLCTLTSVHTDLQEERNKEIRYNVEYLSSSSAMYDIAVISDDEYTRLERSGTLEEDIRLFYFKTKSPVEIDMSFSREQPFFSDIDFYFYLDLRNMGGGSIESMQDLVIYYPSDLVEFVESNDFRSDGEGKLVLSDSLDFYNGKTKRATCKFRVKDVNIRNIGQFKAEANYIYEYHKTINIKVKPK